MLHYAIGSDEIFEIISRSYFHTLITYYYEIIINLWVIAVFLCDNQKNPYLFTRLDGPITVFSKTIVVN